MRIVIEAGPKRKRYAAYARRLFHAQIIDAIGDLHGQGIMDSRAKGGPAWTHRFLIRHLAFHTMDHTWEMEDKDLTS